jgi:hypothetical protein
MSDEEFQKQLKLIQEVLEDLERVTSPRKTTAV